MLTARLLCALAAVAAVACAAASPPPAALAEGQVACASCRMIVSDRHFASQIVAPYEEPLFFDDLGCLTRFLATAPAFRTGAVTYVADHRTGEWVRADRAVFSTVPALSAPMGSHVVAHATPESRAADSEAAGGQVMTAGDVFGTRLPPGGTQ